MVWSVFFTISYCTVVAHLKMLEEDLGLKTLVLFFGFLLAQSVFAQAVKINFDLNNPTGMASGQSSGFLHSLSGTEPPDQFVKPLKIKFWRGACYLDEKLYQRLKPSGAVIQYVLSDGFEHPTQGDCTEQQGTGRWPYQNPALWQSHVESEARRITKNGWKVIWEPWNEPDYWQPQNPNDTEQEKFQQYLDAFLMAYNAVKKVDPNAQFAGPSLSANDWPTARARIETFLRFCAEHHIEVAHLAWHGFDDIRNTHKWPERIREIRELAATKYSSVKVQKIVISEIVAKRYFYSPGDLVMALKYLDDAGADFVSRACHYSSCWPPDLDGSLIKGPDGVFRTTSRWWANFWYAQTTGQRYSGVSSNSGVAATAIIRDANNVAILVGFSRAIGPSKPSGINLNLEAFPGSVTPRAQVKVERVPEQKKGALNAPINVNNFTVRQQGSRVAIDLQMARPGDAYLISIHTRDVNLK